MQAIIIFVLYVKKYKSKYNSLQRRVRYEYHIFRLSHGHNVMPIFLSIHLRSTFWTNPTKIEINNSHSMRLFHGVQEMLKNTWEAKQVKIKLE